MITLSIFSGSVFGSMSYYTQWVFWLMSYIRIPPDITATDTAFREVVIDIYYSFWVAASERCFVLVELPFLLPFSLTIFVAVLGLEKNWAENFFHTTYTTQFSLLTFYIGVVLLLQLTNQYSLSSTVYIKVHSWYYTVLRVCKCIMSYIIITLS